MLDEKIYTGWKKWHPTDAEWLEFFESGKLPFKLLENEYLIVYATDGSINYYCYEHSKLRQFRGGSIKTYHEEQPVLEEVSSKKTKSKTKYSKGKSSVITARNEEQTCAFDLFKDPEKPIKLIEGPFGSGKTLIMVTAALEALKLGKFDQIIWIRNNVDTIGTRDLGALPGDANEKLAPMVGPLLDHAGEAAVRTMLQKGSLKIEPLQFLRGRNFENSLILCTEAENLLLTNIQLIIARAAEGTEVWFDGDFMQADKKMFAESNGLTIMKETFKGNELFGCVTLTKTERSATAAMADLLNEKVLEQRAKLLK